MPKEASVMEFLKGKKSYLLGFLMVLAAGLHAQGYINDSLYATLQSVLLGGGVMALRAAISKGK